MSVAESHPLRVLLLCEATSAGVGGHTIDLMEGLLAAGCEVHLLYSETRIDDSFRRGLAALSGLKSSVLPMTRQPGPSDGFTVAAVRRYMKQHGPFDVVHGQSSKGGAIARLVGAVTGTPAIYTPHCIVTMAPTFGRTTRNIFRWVEWVLAFPTSQIICCSQDEYNHIRSLGVPTSKLRLIRYGIRPLEQSNKQAVRKSLGLPDDALIVGFVGRFSAQKNPELVIEAFAAATQDKRVQLAMIGSGELEEQVKALAAQRGLGDRVHWLGYRNGYQCMPAFDVLAIPSRYEGLPYVMLEGISVGLPLVITAVGGAEDVIDSGKNGFIVPSEDVPAMTNALRQLIESSDLRERFAAAARERSEEFRLSTMVGRTIEVYQECRQRKERAKSVASL